MSTVQQIGQNAAFGTLRTGTLSTPGSLTTGSIKFPTAGGTPSPLADYEEYTDPAFTIVTGTGFNPSPIVTTLFVMRIGKIVFLHLPAFQATGTGSGSASSWGAAASLPARFVPANNPVLQLTPVWWDNGGGFTMNSRISVGFLQFFSNYTNGTFSNTAGHVNGPSTDVWFIYTLI